MFFLQVSQFGVCGYAFYMDRIVLFFIWADIFGLGKVYECECMNVHVPFNS